MFEQITSFDDDITRANFSVVPFVQFYLLKFFLIFFNGGPGFEPPSPPSSGYATVTNQKINSLYCSSKSPGIPAGNFGGPRFPSTLGIVLCHLSHSVGLYLSPIVSRAKTDAAIKMPFALRTQVGPGKTYYT